MSSYFKNYFAIAVLVLFTAFNAYAAHTTDVAREMERVHPYHPAAGYGAGGYHPEARAYARGAEAGAGENSGGGGSPIYVEPEQGVQAPAPAPAPQGE